MEYKLPDLPYPYNALEPYYDEQTLKVHHDIHHKGYVAGLNNAEAKLAEARVKGDFSLIKHWSKEVAFHGSGHILHSLFWENMIPADESNISPELKTKIEQDFRDINVFRDEFSAAAASVEGSGWAVLGWNPMFAKMQILQAEKHQNLTQWGIIPLLVLDVWEHAYYLKYQNRRAEFIEAWWNIVNWDIVEARLKDALSFGK